MAAAGTEPAASVMEDMAELRTGPGVIGIGTEASGASKTSSSGIGEAGTSNPSTDGSSTSGTASTVAIEDRVEMTRGRPPVPDQDKTFDA